MLRRALAIMISGMLWSSALGSQTAAAQGQESNGRAEKARAEVRRLGVGPKSRVEVRLQDGTRLKGSISAAGEDAFTVTEQKTGATRTVAYSDVARVKKPGGVSALTWVVIGVAAAAAVVVGVTVVGPAVCDGGAGC